MGLAQSLARPVAQPVARSLTSLAGGGSSAPALPTPPAGQSLLVDDLGNYLVDDLGNYLTASGFAIVGSAIIGSAIIG